MIKIVLHCQVSIHRHRVLPTTIQLISDNGRALILIQLMGSHKEELLICLIRLLLAHEAARRISQMGARLRVRAVNSF